MIKMEIIGSIGRDAEIKEINGNKYVSFNVASDESWKRPDGTWQKSTTWVSVMYRYNDKSTLHKSLTKGTKVCVYGDMKVGVYQGRDGWTASTTCNTLSANITILHRPKNEESSGAKIDDMAQAAQRLKDVGFEEF